MRYAVIAHKHGTDVYFASDDEDLWNQIGETFDSNEVAILKGEVDRGIDILYIDHIGDVPTLKEVK